MESVLGRYRNLTILVGVLFLQVLGLAVQVKRSGDAQNTRLIRIWAVDAITPFERAIVWAQSGSGNLFHNYIYLRGVRAENRQLQQQIDELRLQQVRLSEDAEQAHRLQQLLAFREQVISKTVPAQVIGSSGSDLSRSVYIDKGSNDGIAPDMAVITAGGVVGKVLRTYPTTALVLMINDQTSGVGAMLEKSRLQGVLKGTPDGNVVLERVMSDEKVTPGDTLISSGGDRIFPKGLPVGTVTKVSPGHEMFLNIQVKPAADLNRLEEVLVVTEKQERDAVADAPSGRVRAADILAQRLPSVPDKPADPSAAPTSAGLAANGAASPTAAGVAAAPPAKPASVSPTGPHTVPMAEQITTEQITTAPITTEQVHAPGVRREPALSPQNSKASAVVPSPDAPIGKESKEAFSTAEKPKVVAAKPKPQTTKPAAAAAKPATQAPAADDFPH